jgi:hypothetical protein
MTQVVPGPLIIDLGVMGEPEEVHGDPQMPVRLRRGLVAAAVVVVCLFAAAGSARVRLGLTDPLWTGEVSLAGFTFGSDSLYLAESSGKVVVGRDLRTGKQRWSLDVTDYPEVTTDVGSGLAAVVSRQLAEPATGSPTFTITFIRESTGAPIARTAGSLYQRSADGLPAVVFSDRRVGEGCTTRETNCLDIIGWNLDTAAVAWRLSLPPGSLAIPSVSDGGMDGLVDMADDGTLRLRELSSGAVVGTTVLSAAEHAHGQVVPMRDALVTARRESNAIVVTAYRRPTLDRIGSVSVPAPAQNVSGSGEFYVGDCGSVLCLHVDLVTTQFIDVSTGSVTPPVKAEVVSRLGDGVFLAFSSDRTQSMREMDVLIVDPAGRIITEFPHHSLLSWDGSGGRALLSEEGPDRTGFRTIDRHGHQRSIGSVPGTNLTCAARAEILACANAAGELRVWRLPD